MVDSGVAWGIIFILAMVQPLSGAMAADESGITPFLMKVLEPLSAADLRCSLRSAWGCWLPS